MYRTRVLPAAVSLTAAAALLLTGCGGGDDDKDKEPIEGAGGESKSSAPASPSASAGPKIDRPVMKFPSDVELVFDKAQVTPEQAAPLNDAQNFLRSIEYGIVKQDPKEPAHRFYSEYPGTALDYAKSQIKGHADAGATITGKRHYYNAKVKLSDSGKTGFVSMCSDGSKLYGKDVKTGEVRRTKKSVKDYYFWQIQMAASDKTEGLWRAKEIQVAGEAKQCM
ncbi:hypothetical protein HUT18_21675 [Streptomyces sp. NA04227]|uniref:hypothetical protein n=1 Tax=Streptomyces sp. NA04227 TaxID=2742136 RepID=UPI0015922922|nr:hypothetical protein [Streptomyces sp. NA04227]QKW08588.1 hypothetical protein HUT18_21675 [Streptomyces sp. NA04227]